MSTMPIEIYDALKEAGASEEKARAAAASLTGRDDRFDRLGGRVDQRNYRAEQRLIALSTRTHALERELARLRLDLLNRELASFRRSSPQ